MDYGTLPALTQLALFFTCTIFDKAFRIYNDDDDNAKNFHFITSRRCYHGHCHHIKLWKRVAYTLLYNTYNMYHPFPFRTTNQSTVASCPRTRECEFSLIYIYFFFGFKTLFMRRLSYYIFI